MLTWPVHVVVVLNEGEDGRRWRRWPAEAALSWLQLVGRAAEDRGLEPEVEVGAMVGWRGLRREEIDCG